MGRVVVRAAEPEDVCALADIHVRSWQETYRGIMRDAVLDDPELLPRRERMWLAAVTDERYAQNRVAVAEGGGELVGIAMSGPPEDAGSPWYRHLYVLYVLAEHHGSGAGAQLLDAVIEPTASASLWVADPNPRAQSFYRKHGFRADGTSRVDDGVREIWMTREGSNT